MKGNQSQRNGIQNLIAYDGKPEKGILGKKSFMRVCGRSRSYIHLEILLWCISEDYEMKIEDDPQKAKDDSNRMGKGISPWIKFAEIV